MPRKIIAVKLGWATTSPQIPFDDFPNILRSIVVPKTQAFADCVPENLWTHVYVKRGKAIFYAIPFRSPNERENGGEREDCHVEFRAKNGVERSEFHACLSLECFPSLSWLREQCRVNTDKCRASNEEMLVYEQSRGRGVRRGKSLRSWLLFIIFPTKPAFSRSR